MLYVTCSVLKQKNQEDCRIRPIDADQGIDTSFGRQIRTGQENNMDGFFMPALKKNNLLLAAVALFALLFSVIAPLQAIDIYSARLYTENDMYYLDAEFDIRLSQEAQRAVRHGIAIKIVIRFQLYQERDWLWDKRINETTLEYQLEHQPLTENYLTVDLKKGLRRSYKSLSSALDAIGSVSAIILFNSNILKPELKYNARIKSYIDLKLLPTPMRPQAYFSANWNTSSKWYWWEVVQ